MNMMVSTAALTATSTARANAQGASTRVSESLAQAADPIFAAIEQHKNKWLHWSEAIDAESDAEEAHDDEADPRPFALVAWRNYSAIGGDEIDWARARYIAQALEGSIDASVEDIEREYRQCVARYGQLQRDLRAWEGRTEWGKASRRLRLAGWKQLRAAKALARIRPTSISGVLALLAYIDGFNRGAFTIKNDNHYRSDFDQWPDAMIDDEIIRNGEATDLPFAFWVMRNIQTALETIEGARHG